MHRREMINPAADPKGLNCNFLIGTPRLEFPVTPTKQRLGAISNRDTLPYFTQFSVLDSADSAARPNWLPKTPARDDQKFQFATAQSPLAPAQTVAYKFKRLSPPQEASKNHSTRAVVAQSAFRVLPVTALSHYDSRSRGIAPASVLATLAPTQTAPRKHKSPAKSSRTTASLPAPTTTPKFYRKSKGRDCCAQPHTQPSSYR